MSRIETLKGMVQVARRMANQVGGYDLESAVRLKEQTEALTDAIADMEMLEWIFNNALIVELGVEKVVPNIRPLKSREQIDQVRKEMRRRLG